MDYQSFHYVFLKYTQNSLEYLIQNMNHKVIQIYHFMLKLLFEIYCYCMSFYVFPYIVNPKI